MTRLLLTADRDYSRRDIVFIALDWAHNEWGFSGVVHASINPAVGHASAWCDSMGIPATSFETALDSLAVLDQHRPEAIILLPGGEIAFAKIAHASRFSVSSRPADTFGGIGGRFLVNLP